MNGYGFQARSGPIIVRAEVTGPSRSMVLKLVLDTGATRSFITREKLVAVGFDPDQAQGHTTMTTGSTVEVVPLLTLTRFSALGQHRFGFPVIGHALPAATTVDGLLGLDFLRDQVLTIDFRAGQISLA